MTELSTNGLRALKVVHLICAILWIGSAVSMNLLRVLVDVSTSSSLGLMQLTLLFIVLVISVWKPWKKKTTK